MLDSNEAQDNKMSLDRARWRQPLISIVVTHYNYSDHIMDALLSLLDQTYPNWECVVVDDGSSPDHLGQLRRILTQIGSATIRLVEHQENKGQIPAFFTGLDATSGEFVCLLDPDDRYAENFLEEALAAHLDPSVICPIVCTDQYLLGKHGIIAGGNARHIQIRLSQGTIKSDVDRPSFIPPYIGGWHWTSTSSMMFRRSAVRFLRPVKQLAYKGAADSYLASGAHRLGGTIFVRQPLVFRQLHCRNAWIGADIVSSFCDPRKEDANQWGDRCDGDALEALLINRAPLPPITRGAETLKKPGLLAKWERSITKRWRSLSGLLRLKNA